MNKQRGFTIVELFIALIGVVFVVFGVGGWVMNIVKIVGTGLAHFDGLLIARCIGVFIAPLGAVLGWL